MLFIGFIFLSIEDIAVQMLVEVKHTPPDQVQGATVECNLPNSKTIEWMY